jgi:hypothetical protein
MREQVNQARKKEINAILVNEDNMMKSAGLWKEARKTAQLIYIPPEMACSDSFILLWKDSKFRARITALVVDETHCIHEWVTSFVPSTRSGDASQLYGPGGPICCLYRNRIDLYLRHHLEFTRIREPTILGTRRRLRTKQPPISHLNHLKSPKSCYRYLEALTRVTR